MANVRHPHIKYDCHIGRTFGDVGKGFTTIVFDAIKGAKNEIIGVINVNVLVDEIKFHNLKLMEVKTISWTIYMIMNY